MAKELVERIRQHSRDVYGVPREEVEEIQKLPEPPSDKNVQIESAEPKRSDAKDPIFEESHSMVSTPGRGGVKHKALQNLVKQVGEGLGYRATIEKVILDGAGYVDVALEREGYRVAVEISVTTSVEHELKNAQKCLEAGYDLVILCAADAGHLGNVARAVEESTLSSLVNIQVSSINKIASYLSPANPSIAGDIQKGYKIKSQFKNTDPSQREQGVRTLRNRFEKILRRVGAK